MDMKMYKGFNKDMTCRGFQYEVGKTYETEKAKICSCGFHACENPFDVLSYYDPANSRFCLVDLEANCETSDDSKRVGCKIYIEAEIGINGLISAGVKFILDHIKHDNAKESNTGNRSAATNTGDCSAAVVSGDDSIAFVSGYKSKAKGAKGCWLVLTERDDDMHVVDVQAIMVDGETIKPDTFYRLRNKEIIEVNVDED